MEDHWSIRVLLALLIVTLIVCRVFDWYSEQRLVEAIRGLDRPQAVAVGNQVTIKQSSEYENLARDILKTQGVIDHGLHNSEPAKAATPTGLGNR